MKAPQLNCCWSANGRQTVKWLGALLLAGNSLFAGAAQAGVAVRPLSIGEHANGQLLERYFVTPAASLERGFTTDSEKAPTPSFNLCSTPSPREILGSISENQSQLATGSLLAKMLSGPLPAKDESVAPTPGTVERRDHLISQAMTDASRSNRGEMASMLIFWNDSPAQADFSDMVAEVKTSGIDPQLDVAAPLLIPLPKALSTGSAGLIGLALIAGFRRRFRPVA